MYDQFQGGSFLTFSTRTIDWGNLPVEDAARMIPKLFTVLPNSVVITNRLGAEVIMTYETVKGTAFYDDPIFGRLMAFETQKVYDMRVP